MWCTKLSRKAKQTLLVDNTADQNKRSNVLQEHFLHQLNSRDNNFPGLTVAKCLLYYENLQEPLVYKLLHIRQRTSGTLLTKPGKHSTNPTRLNRQQNFFSLITIRVSRQIEGRYNVTLRRGIFHVVKGKHVVVLCFKKNTTEA